LETPTRERKFDLPIELGARDRARLFFCRIVLLVSPELRRFALFFFRIYALDLHSLNFGRYYMAAPHICNFVRRLIAHAQKAAKSVVS
jgi:hypothetical protein